MSISWAGIISISIGGGEPEGTEGVEPTASPARQIRMIWMSKDAPAAERREILAVIIMW
jgi:hypothetical protein